MKKTRTPRLAVVIASGGDPTALRVCLSRLGPRCAEGEIQLVVARSGSPAEVRELSASHPDVRFVALEPGASAAELREAGARSAEGDVIAIANDSDVASPDWLPDFGLDQAGGRPGRPETRAVGSEVWAEWLAARGALEKREAPGEPNAVARGWAGATVRGIVDVARSGDVPHALLAAGWGAGAAFLETAAEFPSARGALAFCRDRYVRGWENGRAARARRGPVRSLGRALATPLLLAPRLGPAAALAGDVRPPLAALASGAFLLAWAAGEVAGCLSRPDVSRSRDGNLSRGRPE